MIPCVSVALGSGPFQLRDHSEGCLGAPFHLAIGCRNVSHTCGSFYHWCWNIMYGVWRSRIHSDLQSHTRPQYGDWSGCCMQDDPYSPSNQSYFHLNRHEAHFQCLPLGSSEQGLVSKLSKHISGLASLATSINFHPNHRSSGLNIALILSHDS